ncbi:ATP-binding protein [Orrella daihaiensis]|uniref:histidine kinase n=1 Tax=Orrella daihaiensis TaxID=2782176 RepID=A0ABY4AQI6_9BURK|nr:ATP-binding protein [Orrella daihaiensis]UOD51292.1 response regulator [Orrella daihaiensis]
MTEHHRRNLEETLAQVVTGLPVAASVYEARQRPQPILLVNDLFTRLFGYTAADIPTVEIWAQLAYPDEAYRFQLYDDWDKEVDEALKTHGMVANREAEITTQSGEVLTVLVGARAIGNLVIVTFVDISAQRQTEAELKSVRYKLERTAYELTENLPVGTYTMVQPADGGLAQFRFMSTRFLELCGLNREEAYADPLKGFACVHPEDYDRWLELNARAFANKEPFYGETRLVVNGKTRWITAESKPRALPDGSTVWEGVLADITERKLAEQALARAKARAEELERLKTDFLTQMSHEIRTPLTAILGLADLLADDNLQPSQHDKVTQIQTSGKLLLGIINDILDMSKIEAGQLITEELPFALDELVDHLQTFKTAITKPGVKLSVQQPLDKAPAVIGDKRRIEQVLTNLVGNAIKFTEHGNITVTLDIAEQTDTFLKLRASVTDTGPGIDSDLLQKLFTPFVQADTGVSRRHGGTGLGLSISKQLVELMGGRIGVISEPGKGSQFWFELSLAIDQHAKPSWLLDPNQTEHLGPRKRGPRLAGLNILVVDDSDSIRDLICEVLEREQAQVELASDGRQALEVLRRHKDRGKQFDCVMMDVQMPVMDGLTAMRHIRAMREFNHLPVLAMTAGLLAEQQARARQAGMADVVAKPVDFQQMVEQILVAVGRVHYPVPITEDGENPMPALAGVDREHVNRTMDGNRRLFDRLCRVFVEEFEGLDDRIGAVLDQGIDAASIQEAGRLAHALRGAASQIGALELAQAAAAVEHSLHTDAQHSPAKLAAMGKLLADVIQSLKGHLGQ